MTYRGNRSLYDDDCMLTVYSVLCTVFAVRVRRLNHNHEVMRQGCLLPDAQKKLCAGAVASQTPKCQAVLDMASSIFKGLTIGSENNYQIMFATCEARTQPLFRDCFENVGGSWANVAQLLLLLRHLTADLVMIRFDLIVQFGRWVGV